MDKYKVAIVDDEKLFIEGMRLVLEQEPKLEVTNIAENGQELLDTIEKGDLDADVILLDLSMPVMDGVDTLIAINKLEQQFRVIILTSHYNDSVIVKLLDEGANGFLPKNEDPTQVVKTIMNVAQKGFYINDYILQLIRDRRLLASKKKIHEDLSSRELEVLNLICREYTNKEIANKLSISPRTVEGHRNRILEKTQSKNTVGIVIYAIEHNIFDVNISKYY